MTNTDAMTALNHLNNCATFTRTANGIRSFHLTLLLNPAEFKTLFDAVYPHMELHGLVTLKWDLSEDVQYGEVTLTAWEDVDGAIRASVAEAYCAINEIVLPPEESEDEVACSCGEAALGTPGHDPF